MPIALLEDRILVRRVDATVVSKGGIIIPDAHQEKPQLGVIAYVGPGRREKDGTFTPISVQPGEEVLFGKWSGEEVEVDGEKLLLVREEDILGTMN